MAQKLIGQILFRKYRVDEFIAAGGMGSVYKVYDNTKNVFLAMKVLSMELDDDPSAIKRFKREANAYRKLVHPNIVPYYGMEQSDDAIFLLQKFIDGDSLKGILSRPENKPFPISDTLAVMKALCASLGYAHYEGVVHCDIKPGNILIDQGGNIYLTDFGIARHAESTTTSMADAGTPAYMAPEQIRGESVSSETDVYGLGVLLFEMLTGQRPFRGTEKSASGKQTSVKEKIREAHLTLAPPDPRSIQPDIPVELAYVILKALAKKPQDRYKTTQDFFTSICLACNISIEQVPDRINPDLVVMSETTLITNRSDHQDLNPDDGHSHVKKIGWGTRPPAWIFMVIAGIVLAGALGPKIVDPPALTPTPSVTSPGKLFTDTPMASRIKPSPTSKPQKTATTIPTLEPEAGDTKISPLDGMVMIYIPAGEFLMGSSDKDPYSTIEKFQDEKPQHKVYIESFWIGQSEVTNEMFDKFVKANNYLTTAEKTGKGFITQMDEEASQEVKGADWRHPYGPNSNINGMDKYPVVQMSWFDAAAYCDWVGGRLPTEAEWEKAARGQNGAIYPWGNSSLTGKLANSADKSLNSSYWSVMSIEDGHKYLAPVKSFPEGISHFSLFDMAGNVWEWVSDWYDPDFYSSQNAALNNPQGPTTGQKKGLRGGCYVNGEKNVRTARRGSNSPEVPLDVYGFRCVQP